MKINDKSVLTETELAKLFNTQPQTVQNWFQNGLKHFVVNDINYIFEDELEKYLRK